MASRGLWTAGWVAMSLTKRGLSRGNSLERREILARLVNHYNRVLLLFVFDDK